VKDLATKTFEAIVSVVKPSVRQLKQAIDKTIAEAAKGAPARVAAARAKLRDQKKSEEIGSRDPVVIAQQADLWDVAYQGAGSDPVKKAKFISDWNLYKNNMPPEVVKTIRDTVQKGFAGDEGTDVKKVQQMIIMTGVHESENFRFRKQKGGGPARGIHQVEPDTAFSLIKNSALLGPAAKRMLKAEGLDITKPITKKQMEDALERSDIISTVFATAKLQSGAKAQGRLAELS